MIKRLTGIQIGPRQLEFPPNMPVLDSAGRYCTRYSCPFTNALTAAALTLQVAALQGCLPQNDGMDRLLRYETAIERQLYRTMTELERSQRHRRGEPVPLPIKVSIASEE